MQDHFPLSRCLPGYHEVNGVCTSDCIPNPCFKNVTCRIDMGEVVCVCPPDKIGEFCREPTRALTSSVTTTGIVAIVVSAFVVIRKSFSSYLFCSLLAYWDGGDGTLNTGLFIASILGCG